MNNLIEKALSKIFPSLDRQIWVLVVGRFLSMVGTGFTMFYAAVYFESKVGLAAWQVGLGLGLSQAPGLIGRIYGGTLADSPLWGRRKTIVLSMSFCAAGAFLLSVAMGFWTFLGANLVKGFGVGLFWPASESLIADLTDKKQRVEAYALNRLADNTGLGIGVVLGGLLLNFTGAFRMLFVIDGLSYLVFLFVLLKLVGESIPHPQEQIGRLGQWLEAFQDRRLWLYVPINVLFTFYLAHMHSALPIQFSRIVGLGQEGKVDRLPGEISGVFIWFILLNILLQIPAARLAKKVPHTYSLAASAFFWAGAFILIGYTANQGMEQFKIAFVALAVAALATVSYMPTASSLVADIAPKSRRGLYTSINSLCWSGGYLIGPAIGGWAMDWGPEWTPRYWFFLAASTLVAFLLLPFLAMLIRSPEHRKSG
jgi:MFS family permease